MEVLQQIKRKGCKRNFRSIKRLRGTKTKEKIKKLLIPILFALANPIFSRSTDECKYFQILTYLHTNKKANQQIKKYSRNLVNKKVKFIEFNVSPWIDFHGIREFKDRISDSVGIAKELIVDEKLFFQMYSFNFFKSNILDRIERNESKLFLSFSKPIGNCLVVELLNFNTEILEVENLGEKLKCFLFLISLVISRMFFLMA